MRLYQRGKKGIWWVDGTVLGERINRSAGTTSRPAAQEWAAQLENDTWRRRKLGERPAVTWGKAVLDWLQRHGENRRSIETIKDRLRWLTGKLGADTILPIDPDRLDEVLLAWKPRHGGEGANTTRNRFVAEVSKIHHFAKKRKWLDSIPDLIHYEAGEDDDIRWATQEQADRIIAELPQHLADMARFALATGLRESNVRLFRWDWVDASRGCAWVPRRSVKNKRALFVPLNADALEVLARRRGDDPAHAFVYSGPAKKTPSPVWNCSSAAWYKATSRAGMQGFRWHDWRHTWATWHLMAGTPREVLQRLGGWSDSKMVDRYAHVANEWAAQFAGGSLRDQFTEENMDLNELNAKHFWTKVIIKAPSECWPWIGCTTDRDGYGLYQEAKKRYRSNRVAFAIHHARPLSAADVVRHDCDNPACCNPAHLRLGTQLDNVQDRVKRGRGASGERNGRSASYKSVANTGQEVAAGPTNDPQVLAAEVEKLGWLMGLEPTTTGITKQQPIANVLNLNDALARKRRKTA